MIRHQNNSSSMTSKKETSTSRGRLELCAAFQMLALRPTTTVFRRQTTKSTTAWQTSILCSKTNMTSSTMLIIHLQNKLFFLYKIPSIRIKSSKKNYSLYWFQIFGQFLFKFELLKQLLAVSMTFSSLSDRQPFANLLVQFKKRMLGQ